MNRNNVIDIMKAIGIILMVLGHSGFKYTRWIYQFHMAMFFIIAGYCYNEKYSTNKLGIKKLIINRVKSLYIPCLLFNLAVVLLHNILVKLNFTGGNLYSNRYFIISIVKCFLFSGGESLSGAMWFLRTMFISTILYSIIDYMCELKFSNGKEKIKWFISIILLLIGWIGYSIPGGKYLNVFSVIILFQIGFDIKKKGMNTNLSIIKSISFLIIGFLAITIPMLFEKECISLNINRIINPIYFIWCSVFGTLMCFGISNILLKTKHTSYIQWIGKNTLPIVMFHFAAMKIVTAIQIIYYKKEIALLASHPFLYGNGVWVLLYTIAGVAVPLILYTIYKIIKRKLLIIT